MNRYKININEVKNNPEVKMILEKWYFEDICGSCYNFNTNKCKKLGKVDNYTEWKYIGCKDFMD